MPVSIRPIPAVAEFELQENAPAKINLDLYLLGRRPDGYHELDSLIVFGPEADVLSFAPADDLSLEVSGPFAEKVPHGEANLVLRAARELGDWLGERRGARIRLEKRLPVAAGIGGGSADAAATLRGLLRLWRASLDLSEALDLAARLGADVPVCLYSKPARIRGIGERIDPVRGLPELPILLVHPGIALPTASVFRRAGEPAAFQGRLPLPVAASLPVFADWLQKGRNDLEPPAIRIAPCIEEVLATLRGLRGSTVARMSGSGATCWALFDRLDAAEAAAGAIRAGKPHWWVMAGIVGGPR